jgi:hypothetical protein
MEIGLIIDCEEAVSSEEVGRFLALAGDVGTWLTADDSYMEPWAVQLTYKARENLGRKLQKDW